MRKPVNGGGQDADADAGGSGSEQEAPAARTPRPDVDEPRPAAGAEQPTSDWFAPRKAPAPEASPAAGAPHDTAQDHTRALGQGVGPGQGMDHGTGPGEDRPGAPGLPYFSDAPDALGTPDALGVPDGLGGPGAHGMPGTPSDGPRTPRVPGAPGTGPAGATSGPAFGTAALRAVGAAGSASTAADSRSAAGAARTPGGGLSDDTAVLTPQKPHPGPPPARTSDPAAGGAPAGPRDGRAGAGPSPSPQPGPARATRAPRAAGRADAYEDGAEAYRDGVDAYPPALDEPAPEAPAPTPPPATRSAPAPARKKGRSKLVLLAVAAVAAASVAYGAGLLLNQADVPKGTTVLGVDIGGSTKEEAVQKLDAARGSRAATPLQLEVGGQNRTLAPDKAGLSLDSQATVRAAAGSDYNPVTVIGSLFGAERVAQPVIPVDEEKLRVALAGLSGGPGAVTEGTVKFEPGKVVPVPGKAGAVLDVPRAMIFVRDAYRAQVETGRPNVVELPVATREPRIGQAEIDRAVKEFAEPAMSGLITIRAGGRQIQFGPQRSLPQILSMKAVGDRLEPYYDKKAIDRLLDGTFDGVMITKGDGRQHQLSADDVAAAMHKALLGKTEADRTVTIELDPQG
ncbi:hypothetical protein J5J01_03570 [Streptomyces fradiae]|nr:hypothetical protein J5J01_03570 [Streptomyces fradiae]